MKKFIIGCLYFSGIFSIATAGYMPDRECSPRAESDTTQNYNVIDLSYKFPSTGQFDNGTAGWTAITDGGGQVISYSASTEGWVGLRCSGAQTASIEYGPISISTNTIVIGTSTAQQSYDWDQIFSCVHFRGNPSYGSKLGGKFQIEWYDASNSQCYTEQVFDGSSSALQSYYAVFRSSE